MNCDVHNQIDPIFRDSPHLRSEILSSLVDGEVILKLETLNPIGCFKGRGTDYLLSQKRKEYKFGVVTASAGNLGQGLAYCARKHGIECTIFVPLSASELKIQKMKSFGAEIVQIGCDFDAAKDEAKKWAAKSGATFIIDGKEPELSAGAGTIAFELLRDAGRFDFIIAPVGNGSLINGIGKSAKSYAPETAIVGVCANGAPAMALSFQQKKFVETCSATTIADGIAVRVPVAESLPEFFKYVDEILTVSESEIKESIRTLFRAHTLIVEPAGIAGVAALLAHPKYFQNKRVAVVLCGANLTLKQMKEWVF